MTGHRVACVGLTEISSPSTPRSASLSLICSVYLSRPLCCVCASNPSSPPPLLSPPPHSYWTTFQRKEDRKTRRSGWSRSSLASTFLDFSLTAERWPRRGFPSFTDMPSESQPTVSVLNFISLFSSLSLLSFSSRSGSCWCYLRRYVDVNMSQSS